MKTIQNENDLRDALRIARTETLLARSIATEMDAELAAVKGRFEHQIKEHQDAAAAEIAAVEAYASQHRKALFGEAKSATIDGHEIGYRDNGGAVKTVKGVTEKKALARLLAKPRLLKLFVRNKPAIDKEAIKAKWSIWKGPLQKLGFRIAHEETFFAELDVSADPAEAGRKGGE